MKFAVALGLAIASLLTASAADPDRPLRRYGEERFHFTGIPCASALTSDGGRFAVLSVSQQRPIAIVTIFDTKTRRAVVTARVPYQGSGHFSFPGMMAFSPDGGRLAVAFNSTAVFVLDAASGVEVWRTKDEKPNSSVLCAFDARGRLIRGYENETRVYDLASGTLAATWPVGGVAKVTPDGKTYVRTKKVYAEVEIGDLETGRARHVLPLRTAHNGSENGYAVSHDGRTLAVVHSVSEVHLIDLATGATKRQWALPRKAIEATNAEFAVAFSPDDRVLSLATPNRVLSWELDPFRERPGMTFERKPAALHIHRTPDNTTALFPHAGIVERWDVATGKMMPEEVPSGGWPFSLTPDGSHLVAGDRTGRVGVWNTTTGAFVRSPNIGPPAGTPLQALAVSPDGRHLAYNRYPGDFEVVPLNPQPPPPTAAPSIGPISVWAFLAWSPDSRFVYGHQSEALANRTRFVQYDVAKKAVVQPLPVQNLRAVTPDGKELIYSEERIDPRGFGAFSCDLLRYDLARHEKVGEIVIEKGREEFRYSRLAAFSPADAALAVVSQDRVHVLGSPVPPINATDAVRTTNVKRFTYVPPLVVTSLAFTPNGKWLVTGGEDGSVKVWEVATGKLVRRFDGHDLGVTQVAVAGTGRSAFSAGSDGFVLEWSLIPPAPARLPKLPAELWAVAAGGDPALATPAAWKLMGDDTLRAFVSETLPPVATPNEQNVAKWIGQLDAPAFADRTAATRELAALARNVERPLREALKQTPSAEVRDRLEGLIARFDRKHSPEELRAMRLVQAAEWHRLKEPLTAWATGAPSAVLTREAKAALARLK